MGSCRILDRRICPVSFDVVGAHHMNRMVLALMGMVGVPLPTMAACLDLSTQSTVSVTGELSRPIFPGPPNFEDVRSGDTPEPAYILSLDSPFCVTGDDFVDDGTTIDRIQMIGETGVLMKLVGRSVEVSGADLFGAHTGHHHAPLLMTVTSVASVEHPADAASANTTVEAFYLALEIGDGAAAAKNVIPEKRGKGPLSAKALSDFYGNLKRSLKLLGVSPLSPNRFRAHYTFETKNGRVCNGSSVLTTKQVGSLNLISTIKSETGC